MQKELGLTQEQMQKMREIREAGGSGEEIRNVLTPEQQAKAAAMKKNHNGERADQMKDYLGLSDEQSAKMQQLKKEGASREEIRAVLTPEQQAKMDKMREKRRENKGPQTEQ
jgi:Spy/CpxP family protein refolding chaperone